jgi:hypothetical protein
MDKVKIFISSIWGKSLALLILWNLAIRVIAISGYFLLPERFAPLDFIAQFWQSNFMFWSFANFDGEHYLSIAKYGYQFRSGFPQFAFFPLLPLLIHAVASVINDYYLAGMLVSQTSLYFALVFIFKWCKELKIQNIQLPLLLSTGAIFLASIYTEPLFIMLASMTMYFSEKQWWGRAVLTTALATASRVNGIFLALFLFAKMIKSGMAWTKVLPSSLLSISGIIGYMIFLFLKTGDALAWFHSQGAWGKATATSPVTTFISYLKAISTEFVPDFTHLVVVFEVLVTLMAIYLFAKLVIRKKLDIAYWLYLAGNLAMPIATGSLGSMPRFALILFPLLVVIPGLSKIGKTMYYIFSVSILFVGIIFFTRGYWYG